MGEAEKLADVTLHSYEQVPRSSMFNNNSGVTLSVTDFDFFVMLEEVAANKTIDARSGPRRAIVLPVSARIPVGMRRDGSAISPAMNVYGSAVGRHRISVNKNKMPERPIALKIIVSCYPYR